ncbi:hypothetical protein CYLTODRAFT_342910 [Cylindrobasidium torrendii FP15055 ss-10]|uniref:F-box domain-containing protein n=1 Tax=Cylindrobasidium torrendii FP15055 ss-10 TaxID=1314674 RepID=A0A0D7BRR4_9AGAR|nr:hypothetical protein CYLTODRAFT_342910 [Cylindrobasidium torrendii FP15055 ss-10]
MATTTSLLASLPQDIAREIFEFAAYSDRQCAMDLTLVSKDVRLWTLPVLYHTVRLSSTRAVTRFLEAITPSNKSTLTPYCPLHRRVKHLGIFALGPLDAIQRILTLCTDVQNLACGFSLRALSTLKALPYFLDSEERQPILPQSREYHLIGMSCRDGIPYNSIPSDTTHLHVQLSLDALGTLEALHGKLPSLTHLAVSIQMPSTKPLGLVLPMIEAVLDDASPKLESLRLQVMGSKAQAVADAAINEWNGRDKRLSVVPSPGSLSKQWQECHTGHEQLWSS